MRSYKPYKHVMGVEWPSFHRYQQQKRARETGQPEATGGTAAKTWATGYRRGGNVPGTPPRVPADAYRPGYTPRSVPAVDPNTIFDVNAMWHFIAQMRDTYAGEPFLVDTLTASVRDADQAVAEVINFLRIPRAAYAGYYLIDDVWKQVIGPAMDSLEQAMNGLKPAHVPRAGALRFELSAANELILVYQD